MIGSWVEMLSLVRSPEKRQMNVTNVMHKILNVETSERQGRSDSLDGRNWRLALTVQERRWPRAAPAHTCAAAPGSGGVSSRTPRHRPSRTSRSRLRTARNTCAGTGWSGWHSIIHGRLAHIQQPILYYAFSNFGHAFIAFRILINNSKCFSERYTMKA